MVLVGKLDAFLPDSLLGQVLHLSSSILLTTAALEQRPSYTRTLIKIAAASTSNARGIFNEEVVRGVQNYLLKRHLLAWRDSAKRKFPIWRRPGGLWSQPHTPKSQFRPFTAYAQSFSPRENLLDRRNPCPPPPSRLPRSL